MNLLASRMGWNSSADTNPNSRAVTRSNFLQKSQEIERMVYQDVLRVKLF